MPIFDLLRKLWLNLNLRGVIVLSLSLQVFLVFLAPIRKRGATGMIVLLTWSAYLVADWAADYAFGLLSKGQTSDSYGPAADAYKDLLAFWAPFLLVHLGGPDTITAFALEDNELWRRHLLNLLFQLGAAGYVLYQSLPVNKLIIPTILMFIDGLTKYIERTYALFLASFSKFRNSMLKDPDAGPNYAKLMEEFRSKKEANIPAEIERIPEPDIESSYGDATFVGDGLDDITVIKRAHLYFTTFKGLLVDLIFSFRERNESRTFFCSIKEKDAFKIIEVELNFIYDVLYTKAAVIHRRNGYIFRAVSFISALIALALFYFSRKHHLHEYDIMITYTLLIGAIGLDTAALIMLIFSNWTVATISLSDDSKERSFVKKMFVKSFLMFKSENSKFSKYVLRGRWSRTISKYNLLDECLKKRSKWVAKVLSCLHVEALFEDLKFGQGTPFSEELHELVFGELKQKAKEANDPKKLKNMCAVRGEWALQHNKQWHTSDFKVSLPGHARDCKDLLRFVRDVDYGESLLLWHIATDLCYNDGNKNHQRDQMDENSGKLSDDQQSYRDEMRENSNILSDYMLYLLIKQPNMMSSISGIGQLRFRDTIEETKKFFKERLSSTRDKKTACEELLSVPTNVKPVEVKGDRSKSALFDACMLAKELEKFEEHKWDIMSRVWVELLAFAASHCRPYTHAQQLSKGGELVSLVWLLMFQLGLSEQFQIIEGHARAKLIVDKSEPDSSKGRSNT